MQNINILDPNLGATHPTLVPWVQGMRNAGYSPDQIQMYFRQQMAAQMQGQQAQQQQAQQQQAQQQQAQQQQAQQQQQVAQQVQAQQIQAQQAQAQAQAAQQQQQQMHPQQIQQHHPNPVTQQQQQQTQQQQTQQQQQQQQQQQNQTNHQIQSQPVPRQNEGPQQQQQKIQMARNIVQAYTGRVTIEQVLAMTFERVQQLHNEIVSRLNQSNHTVQQVQAQNQAQVQAQAAQQAAQQQAALQHHPQVPAPQTQRDQSQQHHDYTPNNQYAAQQQYTYNPQQNQHHNTQHPAANNQGTPQINIQPNGGTENPMFENENPIDIVLVLLHQYPQIETWLQSMEYHNTVTTSRTHAVQFLTSLMDSQPQFTQLIKLIQQQLKQRRAQGVDPTQAARNIISNTPAIATKLAANIANEEEPRHSLSDNNAEKASKKKSKRGKKKSKKSSKKTSRKAGKKSGKKSKRKKSKRKKKYSEEEDFDLVDGEEYTAQRPSSGHNNDSGSDFQPASTRKTRKKKASKKKRKKRRSAKPQRETPSEAEFTGGETEEDMVGSVQGGESDDYNPGRPISGVGSRKSERKRRSKKRSVSEMSNGTGNHMASRNKRQKTSHNAGGRKKSNLSMYISPAPTHWKVVSCMDEFGGGVGDEGKGRWRIRLKVVRNPLKEALVRLGSKSFDLDEILDTLADIENDDEIKRTKPAKRRLKEELLQIRGCYQVSSGSVGRRKGDGSEDYEVGNGEKHGVDQFNASDFIKNCEAEKVRGGTGGDDVSDDVCYKCGKCGELVLCDGCPHAFHLLCVGLGCVPEEKWFCNECTAVGARGDDGGFGDGGHGHGEYMYSNSMVGMCGDGDIDMDGNENSNNREVAHAMGGNMSNNVNILSMGNESGDIGKGSAIFGAIFMANKGDGRIGDLAEISNALHPQNEENENENMYVKEEENEIESVDVNVNAKEEENVCDVDEDDAFPEPDIDGMAEDGMNVDVNVNMNMDDANVVDEIPSPDAPVSDIEDVQHADNEEVLKTEYQHIQAQIEQIPNEEIPAPPQPVQPQLNEEIMAAEAEPNEEAQIPKAEIEESVMVNEEEKNESALQMQMEMHRNDELPHEPPQQSQNDTIENEQDAQAQEEEEAEAEQAEPAQIQTIEHQDLTLEELKELEMKLTAETCTPLEIKSGDVDVGNEEMDLLINNNDTNNDSNDTENTDNVYDNLNKQQLQTQQQEIQIQCNENINDENNKIKGDGDGEEDIDIADGGDLVLTGSQEF